MTTRHLNPAETARTARVRGDPDPSWPAGWLIRFVEEDSVHAAVVARGAVRDPAGGIGWVPVRPSTEPDRPAHWIHETTVIDMAPPVPAAAPASAHLAADLRRVAQLVLRGRADDARQRRAGDSR